MCINCDLKYVVTKLTSTLLRSTIDYCGNNHKDHIWIFKFGFGFYFCFSHSKKNCFCSIEGQMLWRAGLYSWKQISWNVCGEHPKTTWERVLLKFFSEGISCRSPPDCLQILTLTQKTAEDTPSTYTKPFELFLNFTLLTKPDKYIIKCIVLKC